MGNYKDTDGSLQTKAIVTTTLIQNPKPIVYSLGFQFTMLSIARDVKSSGVQSKNFQSYRLIGYENRDIADKDFRKRVDAGEIGSGHNVTALYELVLVDNVKKNETLVTSRLRYEKPGPDSVATEKSWTVTSSNIKEGDHATELAFAAGTFAELMRRSPYTGGIFLRFIFLYKEVANVETKMSKSCCLLLTRLRVAVMVHHW